MTSVSLVVINSVKEIDFLSRERQTMLPQFDRNSEDILNSLSLSLISNFTPLIDIKLARLLCRVMLYAVSLMIYLVCLCAWYFYTFFLCEKVVAIHFLVLEKLDLDYGGSGSGMETRMPSIKIPLAGFLLGKLLLSSYNKIN